jgi:hypothetical protein
LAWSKREREEVSFKDCFLGHFLKTAVFKKKKTKKNKQWPGHQGAMVKEDRTAEALAG